MNPNLCVFQGAQPSVLFGVHFPGKFNYHEINLITGQAFLFKIGTEEEVKTKALTQATEAQA